MHRTNEVEKEGTEPKNITNVCQQTIINQHYEYFLFLNAIPMILLLSTYRLRASDVPDHPLITRKQQRRRWDTHLKKKDRDNVLV